MDPDAGKFEVFFDGQCPLCRREIDMIRRKDKRQALILTDIAAADFQPQGRSLDQLMREIHGRTPGGEYVTGVEVFRQIYQRIGFEKLVYPTRLPVIRQLLGLGYRFFAYLRYHHAARRMRKANCSLNDSACDRVESDVAASGSPKEMEQVNS
jgi:predicted DCC family thiol-disulfide oxidoreductase YuxK